MRHDYRKLHVHNGRVRLHMHTGTWLWTDAPYTDDGRSYKHYDVAHNLTRWQALRLAVRLAVLAVKSPPTV